MSLRKLLAIVGRGDTLLFFEDAAEIEGVVIADDRGNLRYIVIRTLQ